MDYKRTENTDRFAAAMGEAAGLGQLSRGRNSCMRGGSNGSEGQRICCPPQGTGKHPRVLKSPQGGPGICKEGRWDEELPE